MAEMGIGFGVQIGAPVEPGDSEQTQSSQRVWLGQQAASVELGWYSKHGCSPPSCCRCCSAEGLR